MNGTEGFSIRNGVLTHLCWENRQARSIIVPSSVNEIGEDVFTGCLCENVVLPEGVTVLQKHAFKDCKNLKSISIPTTVHTIGYECFSGCSSLLKVIVPTSVNRIENYAFERCDSLVEIHLPLTLLPESDNLWIPNTCIIRCSEMPLENSVISGNSFVRYFGKDSVYTIPDGITHIANDAFDNSLIEEIHLPAGLISLGKRAFRNCERLAAIVLPEDLTHIGYECFSNCSLLTTIRVPTTVTTIDSYAFEKCSSLQELFLPMSLIASSDKYSIPESCRIRCTECPDVDLLINGSVFIRYFGNSDSIVVPDGIETIAENAFSNSRITHICLPNGLQSLGKRAFQNCAELLEIVLPETLTHIGYECFSSCSSITMLRIPKSVTTVENYAFERCSAMQEIHIPAHLLPNASSYYINPGCSVICDELDENGFKIENGKLVVYFGKESHIHVPENVRIIGEKAFIGDCMTDVELPEGLQTIESYAFKDCKYLCHINLPNSIKVIGHQCFYGCDSIESLSIPTGLDQIGNLVFSNCSSLKEISVPKHLLYSISNYLPSGCTIKNEASDSNGFVVENGTLIRYIGKAIEITVPEQVSIIGGYAFAGIDVKSINIPVGVTTIQDNAFKECKELNCVVLPDTLTEIGEKAFSGCSSLSSITIPYSVSKLGWHVFAYCKSLRRAYIPDGCYYGKTWLDIPENCSVHNSTEATAGVNSNRRAEGEIIVDAKFFTTIDPAVIKPHSHYTNAVEDWKADIQSRFISSRFKKSELVTALDRKINVFADHIESPRVTVRFFKEIAIETSYIFYAIACDKALLDFYCGHFSQIRAAEAILSLVLVRNDPKEIEHIASIVKGNPNCKWPVEEVLTRARGYITGAIDTHFEKMMPTQPGQYIHDFPSEEVLSLVTAIRNSEYSEYYSGIGLKYKVEQALRSKVPEVSYLDSLLKTLGIDLTSSSQFAYLYFNARISANAEEGIQFWYSYIKEHLQEDTNQGYDYVVRVINHIYNTPVDVWDVFHPSSFASEYSLTFPKYLYQSLSDRQVLKIYINNLSSSHRILVRLGAISILQNDTDLLSDIQEYLMQSKNGMQSEEYMRRVYSELSSDFWNRMEKIVVKEYADSVQDPNWETNVFIRVTKSDEPPEPEYRLVVATDFDYSSFLAEYDLIWKNSPRRYFMISHMLNYDVYRVLPLNYADIILSRLFKTDQDIVRYITSFDTTMSEGNDLVFCYSTNGHLVERAIKQIFLSWKKASKAGANLGIIEKTYHDAVRHCENNQRLSNEDKDKILDWCSRHIIPKAEHSFGTPSFISAFGTPCFGAKVEFDNDLQILIPSRFIYSYGKETEDDDVLGCIYALRHIPDNYSESGFEYKYKQDDILGKIVIKKIDKPIDRKELIENYSNKVLDNDNVSAYVTDTSVLCDMTNRFCIRRIVNIKVPEVKLFGSILNLSKCECNAVLLTPFTQYSFKLISSDFSKDYALRLFDDIISNTTTLSESEEAHITGAFMCRQAIDMLSHTIPKVLDYVDTHTLVNTANQEFNVTEFIQEFNQTTVSICYALTDLFHTCDDRTKICMRILRASFLNETPASWDWRTRQDDLLAYVRFLLCVDVAISMCTYKEISSMISDGPLVTKGLLSVILEFAKKCALNEDYSGTESAISVFKNVFKQMSDLYDEKSYELLGKHQVSYNPEG